MNGALRVVPDTPTALESVRHQLGALIDAFGLGGQRAAVCAAFDTIFRRSLDFPLGVRPPSRSRLNEDGSPIQFATGLGEPTPGLRFVGDVLGGNAGGADRHAAGLAAFRDLAAQWRIEDSFEKIASLVEDLAPVMDSALVRDRAGAFWLGAAFAAEKHPRLRLYINGNWGDAPLDRAAGFAALFGQDAMWERLKSELPSALSPLGYAFTLGRGAAPHGTIYLRGFGVRPAEYARIAGIASGTSVGATVTRFATALLGSDVENPAPSAVLSFGLGPLASAPPPSMTTELEFCGHCLFRDDAHAHAQITTIASRLGLDQAPYRMLADVLVPDSTPPGPPRVHSFIGVSTKSGKPGLTVYMKPNLCP
ncbi:hypothetical protein [Antarctobacter jejuensis]|uniref:hypothetical protein n=1 Tax=Antarctobacter jejuensis TaxID=1439938 RepID=UPI003FD170C2